MFVSDRWESNPHRYHRPTGSHQEPSPEKPDPWSGRQAGDKEIRIALVSRSLILGGKVLAGTVLAKTTLFTVIVVFHPHVS